MSSYTKLEFCTKCGVMVKHNWYDNTPRHYEYTVECSKCKLRTPKSEWPRASENPTSRKLAPKPTKRK